MLSGIDRSDSRTARSRIFEMPDGSFPDLNIGKWTWKALAPHIPPDVRPRRGIES
jgi:hypothetical protein